MEKVMVTIITINILGLDTTALIATVSQCEG